MLSIHKNDTVKVLAGRDKGKTGKVLKVFPDKHRAIVQGINFVKKHTRKRRQEDQAGIVEQESPIDISNLSVICKRCNRVTRAGIDLLADGTKVRYCRKCREVL